MTSSSGYSNGCYIWQIGRGRTAKCHDDQSLKLLQLCWIIYKSWIKKCTIFLEQRTSDSANSSAGQETVCHLWKPQSHTNSEVYTTGSFRQMDPLRFLTICSFNVHFNCACHLSPCLLAAIFSSAFSTRILYLCLVSPDRALSPTHITELEVNTVGPEREMIQFWHDPAIDLFNDMAISLTQLSPCDFPSRWLLWMIQID